MKCKILLFFLVFSGVYATAQTSTDSMLQVANKYFDKKDYKESVKIYLDLLHNEKENVSIFYNLANCYYQTKEYVLAILYYEKALKLMPNHSQIKHNLKLANGKALKKIEYSKDFFLIQWLQKIYASYPSKVWSILFLVVFGLFGFSSVVYFRYRKNFKLMILLLCCSVCFFLIAKYKYNDETTYTQAIIMQDSMGLNSPAPSAKILVKIEKGNKVKVLDSDGNYYKVRGLNNKKVWIAKENLALI